VAGAAASAAASTYGHKHHVGTLERFLDILARFIGGFFTYNRISAGAEAAGSILADVDFFVGFRVVQGLGVSVNGYEFDIFDAGFNHPVDSGAAGAANAYDLNLRERLYSWINNLWHTTPFNPLKP
jgi:hypothetical protein